MLEFHQELLESKSTVFKGEVSEPTCIEGKSGKVDAKFCDGIQRPQTKSQMCNTTPCITKWRVTQWSKCNCCDGLMRRKIQCVRASQKYSDYIRTELKECKGKAPTQTKKCLRAKNCPKNCKKRKSLKKSSKALVSLKDRLKIIDEFVDHELGHYLSNDWNLFDQSDVESGEDANELIDVDSEMMFEDPEVEDEENRDKRMCNENGRICRETQFTTPRPGSIIIDEIPNSEIIVHEMPVMNDHILSNMSDVDFQDHGDGIGDVSVDIKNEKVYSGDDAKDHLNNSPHGGNSSVESSAHIYRRCSSIDKPWRRRNAVQRCGFI
ncbi:hypothetical protein QAD02_000821 [Eretmocerus hayati]|uniref:Uncharacterized protein n=1 Tax=Eretmocerus hayati TaxID=131215 RepID=A0ACC2NEN7_9HYME|nr:hypothetical protein QAD02_000821 [Eretmocerus hayati]